MRLKDQLTSLPAELASSLEREYSNVLEHVRLGEWDDAQVDGGRYAEILLRVIQWKRGGKYSPIGGKGRPNRKDIVGKARSDTSLDDSYRLQIPQAAEMLLDFRNNRNSAHVGDLDPNQIDANLVLSLVKWTLAEIVRLESTSSPEVAQEILEAISVRLIPIVEIVEGEPVVTDASMPAADRALVILYQHVGPIGVQTLCRWTKYSNPSRWKSNVLRKLADKRFVELRSDRVYLLDPGRRRAEELLGS